MLTICPSGGPPPVPGAARRLTADDLHPARVRVEGLRSVGSKANGDYTCTLFSSEAQRLYMPSIICECSSSLC